MLITQQLVKQALELARPTAEAIINTPGASWGSKWVVVDVAFGDQDSSSVTIFGHITNWDPAWGPEKNFNFIASRKLGVVQREKRSTSSVVFQTPWLLQDGEFLYAGGAHRDGISVACSGIKGRADEAIANIVIDCIQMLAHLEADRRRETKNDQIYSPCFYCNGTGHMLTGEEVSISCDKCNGTGRDYDLTDEYSKTLPFGGGI